MDIFNHSNGKQPVVCIQGLGFVGTAMAIAVAAAANEAGKPHFNVIGIDLPTHEGKAKVDAINAGFLPIECSDKELKDAFKRVSKQGNLSATTDPKAFSLADITVVDIQLDVNFRESRPSVDFSGFRAAIRTIGEQMRPGSLVLIETTVPPGTCEKVVAPALGVALEKRGLNRNEILLAHSYERVMPGKDYYRSIVDFWRVYAGRTPEAADAAENFLSKIINVNAYPLTRLNSTIESETGKVLENSYRAVNIAFIEEWGRFAESAGINLFAVLDAIRVRPTHNNIRQPGFGVGGYCLTKDPLLADIGARELLGLKGLEFSFSSKALEINAAMPLVSLGKVREMLGGSLYNKNILLLGVSYRPDIGDTRYSPSETFVRAAENEGAVVIAHDPIVQEWPELKRTLNKDLPELNNVHAVVFAVPHREYQELDVTTWLKGNSAVILDANNVLKDEQILNLAQSGRRIACIGRGI